MADSPLLSRADIERVLGRLAERLHRRGVTADLYVFGGAAIALAFDARRATRDVDALFVPHGVVLEEASAVAEELDSTRPGSSITPACAWPSPRRNDYSR